MKNPAFESATRQAAMIRRKKIGCLELLDHYIARHRDDYNPAVNAIVVTDLDAARKRAADAADRGRGEPAGRCTACR